MQVMAIHRADGEGLFAAQFDFPRAGDDMRAGKLASTRK